MSSDKLKCLPWFKSTVHKVYVSLYKQITINKTVVDFLLESQLDSLNPSDLSLPLHGLLSLAGVQGSHVLRGGDEVQDADAGLQQADRPTEALQPVEPGWRREHIHNYNKNYYKPLNLKYGHLELSVTLFIIMTYKHLRHQQKIIFFTKRQLHWFQRASYGSFGEYMYVKSIKPHSAYPIIKSLSASTKSSSISL